MAARNVRHGNGTGLWATLPYLVTQSNPQHTIILAKGLLHAGSRLSGKAGQLRLGSAAARAGPGPPGKRCFGSCQQLPACLSLTCANRLCAGSVCSGVVVPAGPSQALTACGSPCGGNGVRCKTQVFGQGTLEGLGPGRRSGGDGNCRSIISVPYQPQCTAIIATWATAQPLQHVQDAVTKQVFAPHFHASTHTRTAHTAVSHVVA